MPNTPAAGSEGSTLGKSSPTTESPDQLWDLVQATISRYALRDSILDNLEPYYFLDEDKDPERTDDEDELLEIMHLPHGTDVVDLVQGLLAGADLNISVPARSDKTGDKLLADQAEAWLAALVRANERASGQGLLDRAAWLAAMRAAFCARVLFRPDHLDQDDEGYFRQSRRPPILLQVRDPRHVYPEFSNDGLLYVVERSSQTVAHLRYLWGDDLLPDADGQDEVEFVELWTRTAFCYWSDGQLVPRSQVDGSRTPGPWPHNYGDIPYVYRFCQQTGVRDPERRARPILEARRHVIDALDVLDSVELTTIREYGGDALLIQTQDPAFQLDLAPLAQNFLRPNERVDWLRATRQPFESANARAKYEAAFQRGTFPYSLYGQDPGRIMSGYSISLLNQSGQTGMRRIIDAIEVGLSDLLSKALCVAENVVGPLLEGGIIRLYGRADHRSPDGARRSLRQEIALDTRKLAGYHEVDVTLGDVMPQDQASNIAMALRARQPDAAGRPLLSWQTTMESFKIVPSAAEERARIDEEMAANDPEVAALRRAIFAAKVKQEMAEELAALGIDADQVLAQAAQTPGPPGAGSAPPPGSPGAGSALPPGFPPEMLAAALQGPPPGAPPGAAPGEAFGPGMPPGMPGPAY